jgi:hypothetical protein
VRFTPPRCPYSDCPSTRRPSFRWRFKGFYRRKCDNRLVQRFLCLHCHRRFSSQTFRLDFRLHRPYLHLSLFSDFISKVTHRQSARLRRCTRRTIAHRLELLGNHAQAFHQRQLGLARQRGGLRGRFQLDELETFEHNRRLKPVTVPVLIERKSFFVLQAEAAPMPCRGRLSEGDRAKKAAQEARHGKRRSGSRAAVGRCFDVLARCLAPCALAFVQTDQKSSYRSLLRERFPGRLLHPRFSSTAARNYANPLFPINHTFAMLRDGLSRLVRRSWAAAKLREKLARHLWIWILWRNYVRGITNRAKEVTPAMALGVADRRWTKSEILKWRVELQA